MRSFFVSITLLSSFALSKRILRHSLMDISHLEMKCSICLIINCMLSPKSNLKYVLSNGSRRHQYLKFSKYILQDIMNHWYWIRNSWQYICDLHTRKQIHSYTVFNDKTVISVHTLVNGFSDMDALKKNGILLHILLKQCDI